MNETSYDPDKPVSQLHGLFSAISWLLLSLLAAATAAVVLNWLDDFLHAPLGIKDDPPEPGVIVQFAHLAWIPLLLSWFIFGFLSVMSRFTKTIPLVLGTSLLLCGVTSLVGGVLGEYKGTPLFQGQRFFTHDVTPVLYVIFLVSFLGLALYGAIENWRKERQLRKKGESL